MCRAINKVGKHTPELALCLLTDRKFTSESIDYAQQQDLTEEDVDRDQKKILVLLLVHRDRAVAAVDEAQVDEVHPLEGVVLRGEQLRQVDVRSDDAVKDFDSFRWRQDMSETHPNRVGSLRSATVTAVFRNGRRSRIRNILSITLTIVTTCCTIPAGSGSRFML